MQTSGLHVVKATVRKNDSTAKTPAFNFCTVTELFKVKPSTEAYQQLLILSRPVHYLRTINIYLPGETKD